MTRRSVETRRPASQGAAPSRWQFLTRIALFVAGAIVIARMTTLETLRGPWEAVPGAPVSLRYPGPATSLLLDLLALLPALLVLARRAVDRTFTLRFRWSYLPMLLLAAWALLSILWAADQFSALIAAGLLASGLCLLWAVSQSVRSGASLRLIASLCFSLLLVLVAKSVFYRVIDAPANQAYFMSNRLNFFQERGWAPGSFHAVQFEQKLMSAELVGFYSSANTLAAVTVFLIVISCGIGIQKLKDGESRAWLLVPLVAVVAGAWIIVGARSKTAAATPVLGVILFLGVLCLRPRFKNNSVLFYWMGLIVVAVTASAAVGLGLRNNGLFPGHFSNSLDFRWKYWVASSRVFLEHPIRGVGWNNFGLYYLAHRLAEASEEIQDPHNILVRFFVELGTVGGTLLVSWLLRLAWELTRPGTEHDAPMANDHPPARLASAMFLPVVGMLLSILVNVDFTQIGAEIILEMLRDVVFLLVLVLGTVLGAMLSPHQREMDSRTAPWLFYCMLIAAALMLIHNLIDFSLFEAGPMFLFFLVVGSVLGVAPAREKRPVKSTGAVAALFAASVAWLVGLAFVAQVVVAEQSKFDASEDIRTAPTDDPGLARAHFARAAAEFRSALDHVPFNADYALQCAKASLSAGEASQARDSIATAIRINPRLIDAYLLQANLEVRQPHPDAALIQSDFDHILELNPNDVSLHTQYGEALEQLGLLPAARRQYELALKYDAALPEDEPKRLSAEERRDLQNRIVKITAREK